MNLATLVARSLRFHWRSHVGVALGSAVAATVLVGALLVGDSVRGSLARMARARLGGTHLAVVGGSRFFRDALAGDLSRDLGVPAAAVLQVGGIAARADGTDRVNQAQVIGTDAAFWRLGGAAEPLLPGAGRDAVAVGDRLVRRLGVGEGDRLVLRLAEADTVPADVPLSGARGTAIALRPTVRAVAGADAFGRFSLAANQVPPFNVYLPRARLQAVLGLEGKANLLLIGGRAGDPSRSAARRVGARPERSRRAPAALKNRQRGGYGDSPRSTDEDPPRPPLTVEAVETALRRVWTLADGGLDLTRRPERGAVDLTTRRVFLDPPVSQAAGRRDDALGILTYLVNELRVGDRATPYSMVTAMGPLADDLPAEARERLAKHLPAGLADLADDEILLNRWLAGDLHAGVGDEVALTYHVPGEGGRIDTASATFRVGGIVPIEGPAADATLMPRFPGVSEKADCRQWEPGVPIDLERIRDKDEAYWDSYGGTPKAFLTLRAGRRIWANRFGETTAVRFVGGADEAQEEAVRTALREGLDPASLGLVVEPVRERAQAAAGQALDFGQLFLALSMFLIAAALVLTGLLFAFSTQRRAEETGTLLAVGYRPRRVRRLMLAEGAVIVAVGTLVGTAGGLAYTRLVLVGLATVWRSAVGASEIQFHAEPASLVVGAAAGIVVALVTIWLTLRRQGRAPARELLAAGAEADLGRAAGRRPRPWIGWTAAAVGVAGAAALIAGTALSVGGTPVGAFFGAGALLLGAGLSACWAVLGHLERSALTNGKAGEIKRGGSPHPPRDTQTETPRGGAGAPPRTPRQDPPQGSAAGAETRRAPPLQTRRAPPTIPRRATRPAGRFSVRGLGWRNATRRRGRSLATVALVAFGAFLVIAVGANRRTPVADPGRRASGTGGFRLMGETTIPVHYRLLSEQGLSHFALPKDLPDRINQLVAMRAREGDTASCLNLNRVQKPRLLGVAPEALARRGAFTFAETAVDPGGKNPWTLLEADLGEDVVPAVGDANSVRWSLGLKVGEALRYTDGRGRPMTIRIVGTVRNSILQGALLIGEDAFREAFPAETGYRMFLIDTPAEEADAVAKTLSRQLADVGLSVTPTARRLADLGAMQNTYLLIFQTLGGLGLLLGSAGLGVVVLRNVLERRGELALMQAVGWRRRRLHRLLLVEHWGLLAMGLGCGVVSAALAVAPVIANAGSPVPYLSLAGTLLAVGAGGLLWTYLATRAALRGPLPAALRNE